MIEILFIAISTFCLSIFLFPFAIKFFAKIDFVDKPFGIKKHSTPTPYGGGVVVFFAIFLSLFLFCFFKTSFIFVVSKFFLVTSTFFLIGLLDDCFNLSPLKKVGLLIAFGVFIFFVLNMFVYTIPFLLAVLFFIILLSNACNLVDVSDGLLASTLVPILMFFIGLGFIYSSMFFLAFLAAATLGGILGFLKFNFHPARIFSGDTGAFFYSGVLIFLFLNFLTFFKFSLISLFVVTLLSGVPLAEVVALICIRTYKLIPFYKGSPHHFKHYLANQGLSQNQIALVSFSASLALSGLASMLILKLLTPVMGLIIAGISFFVWVTGIYHPSKPLNKFFTKG